MPTIRWSSGAEDTAATWDELLATVNRLPWNRDLNPAELREALALRALRWSKIPVDPLLPAEEFFRDLAYAKLIEIVDWRAKREKR